MGVSFPSVEVGHYGNCCETEREGKMQTFNCIAMRALCISNRPEGPHESDIPPPLYDTTSVIQTLGERQRYNEEAQLSKNIICPDPDTVYSVSGGASSSSRPMLDVEVGSSLSPSLSPTSTYTPTYTSSTPYDTKQNLRQLTPNGDSEVHSLAESQTDALHHQLQAGLAATKAQTLRMQLEAERAQRKANKRRSPQYVSSSSQRSGSKESSRSGSKGVGPGKAVRITFYIEPGEFEIAVDELARMTILQSDGTAVITQLLEPLQMTVNGNPGVMPGDTVALPGGSVQQLRMTFRQGGRVTLLVSTRPDFFDVELRCEGDFWHYLGIKAAYDKRHADRLRVQTVHDHGLVPTWNEANPTKIILAGDWITHVNGAAGNAKEMADAFSRTSPGDIIKVGIKTRARTWKTGGTSGSMTPRSGMSGSTVDWG